MRVAFGLFLYLSAWYAAGQNQFVIVLGVVQDGGYPHIGCQATCCAKVADSAKRFVTSLALADVAQKKWWLFEATPNINEQLHLFQQLTNSAFNYLPDGIFLTHAHIGHYTGLMQLGREAMNSKNVAVYVLPKMADYLRTNGPWSQLVNLKNIELNALANDVPVKFLNDISVTAFTVPHRDEFSETAGFKISTSNKTYLFIPDIDKWQKWKRDIVDEVRQVDIAFLDATFYSDSELPGRNISEVPHPFVSETMTLFSNSRQKNKIHFIHFNHTNPLLWDKNEVGEFSKTGFRLAKQGAKY